MCRHADSLTSLYCRTDYLLCIWNWFDGQADGSAALRSGSSYIQSNEQLPLLSDLQKSPATAERQRVQPESSNVWRAASSSFRTAVTLLSESG